MAATGEPYTVAARNAFKVFGEPVSVSAEECPGTFTWSAFGANYMDTVCANSLEWPEEYQGWGLCDADDDFRDKGIPCPFCNSENFVEYQYGGGYYRPYWVGTDTQVPDKTTIHFHEKENWLWMSAEHNVHGELKIEFRENIPENDADEENYTPYILDNGDTL
jgi:hypothetical protein